MSGIQVHVKLSGIWQMTSTVIVSGRSCLVVDPGYFPRELEDIARSIPTGVTVEALLLTHSHWDHIIGHRMFPGVPIYTSPVLVRSVLENGDLAQKAMAEAREFDSRWYIERPWGYEWPEDLRALDDESWFNVGDLDLQAVLLPGHAPDCMAIHAGTHLLVGDYLSPCEIPFVEDLAAYRRTLKRLLVLMEAGIETVIPGHGPPLSAAEARRIVREDLRYLNAIDRCAENGDADAAARIDLPRAGEVPGMGDHHRDNCMKAGLPMMVV
jgi:glyoxylase-like metal-dependent hydrolase (beta-lactamase superfamily II)